MRKLNFVMACGQLFVMGTPIGHRLDVTVRVLEKLPHLSGLACEDTRQTRKLLTMYDVKISLYAYHSRNAKTQAFKILENLQKGESWGLVTDCGMPSISDPGCFLVSLCHDNGVPVTVLPGPSAVTAALALSGFAGQNFYFQGFLPRTHKTVVLRFLKNLSCLIVFFESSSRIIKTLQLLHDVLGNRKVAVMREITKIFETIYRGNIKTVIEQIESQPVKGEWVFVMEGVESQIVKNTLTESLVHILTAPSKRSQLDRIMGQFPHVCRKTLYHALCQT